jgi:hypothetical protein
LPFTALIERPLLHRGGSASKKGTWPLLPQPSKLARFSLQVGGLVWPLTAPVERGPSKRARSGSTDINAPSKLARCHSKVVRPG